MASPTNWLIAELIIVGILSVIGILVAVAAARQAKQYGINGQ